MKKDNKNNTGIVLTIGVPIYNAEQNIGNLLSELMKIDSESVEVVLVDDGSKDDSLKICKQYQCEKVRVYSQKNIGPSKARNKIIKLARGEWITFIDSDDMITANEYLKVLPELDDKHDWIINIPNKKQYRKILGLKDKNSVLSSLIEHEIINSPVAKFYKNDILKKEKIVFNPIFSIGEDLLFNIEYSKEYRNLKFCNKSLYTIQNVDGSLTRRLNKNKYDELMTVNNLCMNEYKDNNKILNSLVYVRVKNCLSCLRDYSSNKSSFDDGFLNKVKKTKILNKFCLNNFRTTFVYWIWKMIPKSFLTTILKYRYKNSCSHESGRKMHKKNILLVVGSLDVGGIEKLVASYSTHLSKNECQLYYLVFGDKVGHFEKEVLNNGAKIIRIPIPKNRLSLYRDLCSILEQYGPFDIIHSHILFSSGWVMKAAYDKSVEIRIAHSHDNLTFVNHSLLSRVYHRSMKKLIDKYSTKKVACSKEAGMYLFGDNFFEDNGMVLKNRISINDFVFSKSDRKAIRKELGIADHELLIGNIGRLETQKNQKFIVDIIDSVKDSKNMKAAIIGDGAEYDNLTAYIEEKGQRDKVLLLGRKENVVKYLSAMDVFVLPSIHEGLGLVLIEAQVNGLPCLAFKDIVPEEAKVLNSFQFVSQNKNALPSTWAPLILKAKREDAKEARVAVREAGYDIDGLRNDLLSLYEINGEKK